IDTQVVRFRVCAATLALTAQRVSDEAAILSPEGAHWLLTDVRGKLGTPRVERIDVEAAGPLRATVRLEGRFRGRVPARFVARLGFHAGTALVRVDFTLHNPRRARHPGGLWDLGDGGSLLFR